MTFWSSKVENLIYLFWGDIIQPWHIVIILSHYLKNFFLFFLSPLLWFHSHIAKIVWFYLACLWGSILCFQIFFLYSFHWTKIYWFVFKITYTFLCHLHLTVNWVNWILCFRYCIFQLSVFHLVLLIFIFLSFIFCEHVLSCFI